MTDQLSQDLASLRIERNAPQPSSGRGRIFITLVLLLGIGAVGYFWGLPFVKANLFKTEVSVTEISSISPVQAAIDVTSTGYVVPQVIAKVGAKVVGRITKVNIREGEQTKEGQLLFELDPTDQKSAMVSAQSRIFLAQAKAQAARANLNETQVQWQRQKKLVESGSAAASTAEDLGTRVQALQEQVKATNAEIAVAQAETSASSAQLKHTTIASPINGIALTKPAQLGDIVTSSTTLVELADFSTLLVETDVPETRLHLIKNGGPCEIVLDSNPSQRFRGSVVDISPKLNRSKATAIVKVKFMDTPERLYPEMSARVSFLTKPLDLAQLKESPKIVVPANAIIDRNGQKFVFVVDGGKVRKVIVKLGSSIGAGFELKEGPAVGTRIVSEPPQNLNDGQPVKERNS